MFGLCMTGLKAGFCYIYPLFGGRETSLRLVALISVIYIGGISKINKGVLQLKRSLQGFGRDDGEGDFTCVPDTLCGCTDKM